MNKVQNLFAATGLLGSMQPTSPHLEPVNPKAYFRSMPNFLRLTVLTALLAGTTACTTASLQELRQATPSGNAFQAALASEYLAFSESEARQYDWPDSKYFAEKGLKAAYGHETQPEIVENWDIEPAPAADLAAARTELLKALESGVKESAPQLAARAQFFFDCWVEQQEEAWQEDAIASCRNGLYKSLKEIEALNAPAVPAELMPMEEPLIFSSSYIVFFEWNRFDLTADAMEVVTTVAEDVRTESDYEIVLHGHADRSGDPNFNLKLSQKRAEATKAALVARGVPAEKIRYFAYGETDLRVPTPDGVRERANRRVEIFFE